MISKGLALYLKGGKIFCDFCVIHENHENIWPGSYVEHFGLNYLESKYVTWFLYLASLWNRAPKD